MPDFGKWLMEMKRQSGTERAPFLVPKAVQQASEEVGPDATIEEWFNRAAELESRRGWACTCGEYNGPATFCCGKCGGNR